MKNIFLKLNILFKNIIPFYFGIFKKIKSSISNDWRKIFVISILSVFLIFILVNVYLKFRVVPYSEITTLVNNGNFKEAEYKLESLFYSHPNDSYVMILLAKTYVNLAYGDKKDDYLNKSLDVLLRAENINPNLVDIFRIRANVYVVMKKYSLARDVLNGALNYIDQKSVLLSDLGNIYIITGHIAEASNHFNKALSIDPENLEAKFGSVKILFLQKRFDQVVNQGLFITERAVDPKIKMEAYGLVANSFSSLNNFKDAKYYFEKILNIDQNNVSAIVGLGELSLKSDFGLNNILSNTKNAEVFAEKALSINPFYPFTYKLLSNIYTLRGDKKSAEDNNKKFLELIKGSGNFYLNSNVSNSSSKKSIIKVISVKSIPTSKASSTGLIINIK